MILLGALNGNGKHNRCVGDHLSSKYNTGTELISGTAPRPREPVLV